MLTPRELEVVKLVAAGLTNRDIANRLGLSARTIDAHLRSIYGKIGVTSRSGATRYAMERELH
ncbi:MAG: helix-turn-helix transcriptional regulator [Candidatus Dormibacter sp.]